MSFRNFCPSCTGKKLFAFGSAFSYFSFSLQNFVTFILTQSFIVTHNLHILLFYFDFSFHLQKRPDSHFFIPF